MLIRVAGFACNMISFQIEIGAPSGDLGMGLTATVVCATIFLPAP